MTSRIHKYVNALPAVLEPNCVYYIRVGAGFKQVVTTSAGVPIYPISTPAGVEDVATPVLDITPLGNNFFEISGEGSIYNGDVSGSQTGRHNYFITTMRQKLDLNLNPQSVPTVAGANVVFDGNDSYEKDAAGNAWNAWFQSQDPVGNPLLEDFAITWLVESIDGTIREMGGLDDNPSQNASFSSGEFMLYQVNETTLYPYERGSNRYTISNAGLVVGDRLGVRVERMMVNGQWKQIATYFMVRSGVSSDYYVSELNVTAPLFFKGALNRGDDQSGESVIGGLLSQKATVPAPVSARISGEAQEPVSADDIARLAQVGLIADTSSVYSKIIVEQQEDSYFPATAIRNIVHGYGVNTGSANAAIPSN